MVNGTKKAGEASLKSAFESGYSNAVSSLSKLVRDRIEGNNYHFGFHQFNQGGLPDINRSNGIGNITLLTTEIFGEATGKSYLFLSQHDVEVLTHGIYGNTSRIDNIKEEYLKELDNILSASVITKLSNELSIKIYCDIPNLLNRNNGNINSIIEDDFNDQTDEIYINAAFFTFEKYPTATPFFVWVMDSATLKCLQPNSVI
jgi:chemotaxis protein CheY-P-specific phosphatase CheC